MKVAVISKSGRNGGGASRVAEDSVIWLNEAGHPTDHFIAHTYNRQKTSFQQDLYGQGLVFKLCSKVHGKTEELGFREIVPLEYWLHLSQIIDRYDVVHFHDLYTAISPLTLASVARRKPTFFTVHDCSAFTGGCLYPMGCEKFKSHCHECPQPVLGRYNNPIPDRTGAVQAVKRWLAKHSKVQYIFPSRWMANEAAKSLEYHIPPMLIPYGLDLRSFPRLPKADAKSKLGIAPDRKTVVLSAHVLHDPRKGVQYAIEALQSVRDLNPLVLVVGLCDEPFQQKLQGLEFQATGYISDLHTLALTYAASDAMLFCSLADNLPLTVLEAMAASTPVVGFATGGIPEMIQTGRNGFLVEPTNQEALNDALKCALLSPDLETMGRHARSDVEAQFSHTTHLERLLEIYSKALQVRL